MNRGISVDRVTVAEGYERWAAAYDHDPNPLLAREERYLAPIVLGLKPKRALDVACGTGRWIEKLSGQSNILGVGIDSSKAMLHLAGEKVSLHGKLAQADCESLPFRSGIFDLAVCSFALGHIQNLAFMARELARVTAAGADIFVSDLHPEALSRGWKVGFRDHAAVVEIEMISRSTDEIMQLFCVNGFDCVAHEALSVGDAEQPIFARAGKADSFIAACQFPAVLVCRFERNDLTSAP